MNLVGKAFLSDNWKRVFAWVVVWGYLFNVVLWGAFHWGIGIWNAVTSMQLPGPPLIPWEQLAVMTANLAVIGGVQLLKDKEANRQGAGTTSTVEASVETTTVKKG